MAQWAEHLMCKTGPDSASPAPTLGRDGGREGREGRREGERKEEKSKL